MSMRLKPLTRLEGAQLSASNPDVHAALSASAGTGKTHVLTARVLRLLLSGVDPASILCLTFTKAGAAEMADRIHQRLARWVRLKDTEVAGDLIALGEDPGPETVARARTLLARLLEANGGGLRIQTIHAFAQGLLAAFPAEADVTPGFQALDEREQQVLVRSALADMLIRAEQTGDLGLIRDVQTLSLRLGEGGAESFLQACARVPDAMAALGPRQGIEARLRHAFELPLGELDEMIAAECAAFDVELLGAIRHAQRAWGAAEGLAFAEVIGAWLSRDGEGRATTLGELATVVLTGSGNPRKPRAGLLKVAPGYEALAERLIERCGRLLEIRAVGRLVAVLAAALRAGQAFALAYVEAKRATGVVDFDDLIRHTEKLLATPGMGDWVSYKLDQRTDHVLVDEAQDTNAPQWTIVEAIVSEFFAGQSASSRHRTLFTVGDFKQAIFGFQGTDPQEFEKARAAFRDRARGARDAALDADLPLFDWPPDFLNLSVDLSYRSVPAVLDVVDAVLDSLGHEALGLPHPPNRHQAHFHRRAGSVTLWQPLGGRADDDDEEPGELGEESWLSEPVRDYAERLARQVKEWLEYPFWLESKKRALRPEDIMILVRRRGELASLLVARLHRAGVPVAGIDRLRLSAPLAVQDLLAAARFAAQPLDDLNLAALLVSPLVGWSQEQLLVIAGGRADPLWPTLRRHAATPQHTLDSLQAMLAMADYATPYEYFETLLSGPLEGRRKILERLGIEARDPVEELLSSALQFEGRGSASLQAFLDWFDRGEVEIVRDPSGPHDVVRVLTVHGAKGLQAPVVILADACVDPDRARNGGGGRLATMPLGERLSVPIIRPKKNEMVEPLRSLIARADRREREEHWRLLYVALTRAEERVYVAGALGTPNGPAPASWFRAVETALTRLGSGWSQSALWTQEMRYGSPPVPRAAATRPAERTTPLPDWLHRPAPAEPRPPRPLAPSSLGHDDLPTPPPGPEGRAAAQRGRLLHQLFERLPGVAERERRDLADRWLERSAGVVDAAAREALIEDACRIIDNHRFSALFGSEALAEAPVAAVVGEGIVVAGTIDRLLIEPDRVLIADFKTSRQAPAKLGEIPKTHVRQMAAYREALRVIFPDRKVEAALLYTAAPVLHALPDDLLDAHRPG